MVVRVLACLLFGLAALGAEEPVGGRPNIILVVVDDLGWGDLAFCPDLPPGRPEIPTPRLADMASNGALLSRHYTAAPVCAPARASLFSGVHQGHAEVVRNTNFDAALENSHTLASVLRQAGYATALVGKWGLGGGMEDGGTPQTCAAWPTSRGFDFFFGYNNHIAGHRHYPKEEANVDPDVHANAVWEMDRMITPLLDNCYSTDLFTARAKKWIQDHRAAHPGQPFFLALTLTAPHARLAIPAAPFPKGGLEWIGMPGRMVNTAVGQWDSFIDPRVKAAAASPAWRARAAALGNANELLQAEQRFATMVARVDDAVGDLVDTCRRLRIDRNTFIVFLSDNGPHFEGGAAGSSPGHPSPRQNPAFFRSYGGADGMKCDVWDGGLRVPCLVYAPGIVKGGMVHGEPCQFHDWMATFAELAGVPVPMRCDGVSLLPLLTDSGKSTPPRTVYSEFKHFTDMAQFPDYAPNKRNRKRGEQQAIIFREPGGRTLKAIRTDMVSGSEDFEIYDIMADPHESTDLAPQMPQLQPKIKALALQNRRAYDYTHDDSPGHRRNPCTGARPYDSLNVPADGAKPAAHGLVCRQIQGLACPWVPEFDTLPPAALAAAVKSTVPGPAAAELPAKSITNFKGYLNIPADGVWHFYLTLDKVDGSKAYLRMHRFQLIDADFSYKPGATVNESAAINAEEAAAATTGKRGIPLAAGPHSVDFTVVQGEGAPGKLKLEWEGPNTPRQPIPQDAWRAE